MSYTLQQEHQILGLIKQRRKQLQDDREALRKADELSDANKYEKSIDEAIVALTDAASITADDSKWTKRDLGILKRGVNWLEDQYREETKEK